ncbi:MAG: damage-control phosphatase ARMT1 family protein [Bacillota bacterium]
MKIQLECLPCIFRQTLESSRMVTDDEDLIKEIMEQYAKIVPEVDADMKGPTLVGKIQKIVKEKSGVADPYREFKQKHMKLAQELYPRAEDIVDEADDSLFGSLVISATGNAIDAGLSLDVDVAHHIKQAVKEGFVKSDFAALEKRLKTEEQVLIIGDNSGEAIFDKLLIKELKQYDVEVIYAYRDVPILNDVSIKEVQKIGIDQLADRILSSGCKTSGTVLEETTVKFREIYEQAGVIISKGQGNFEGLSDAEQNIFFLLKAKCEIVANMLEVDQGDLVLELR